MVFYIHDQGARGITPVDSLLRQSGVPKVSRISAINRIHPGAPADAQHSLENYLENEVPDRQSSRRQAIFAGDVMHSPVQTVRPEQSLAAAARLLQEGGYHHLPVVNDSQQLCGILSDRDLLRYIANHPGTDPATVAVGTVMTARVISVAAETEIRVIAEVMCSQRISALPVVAEDSRLTGIVTRSDILRTLVQAAPLELWV